MKPQLSIWPVAFENAKEDLLTTGYHRFCNAFRNYSFLRKDDEPDIVLFLSGGSEQSVVHAIDRTRFYLLIASAEGNAYAAAAETSAWMRNEGVNHMLVSWGNGTEDKLEAWLDAMLAVKSIHGKRIGIIGSASPWLIASSPGKGFVKQVFGAEVFQFAWDSLGDWKAAEVSQEFMEYWSLEKDNPTHSNTSRVYSHLKNIIEKEKLDAVSVECFPIATHEETTACLALAQLNDEGIIASCEGDITSTLGMMIAGELCGGSVSWMANLNGKEGHSIFFSHCTIARSLTGRYELDTHFETGHSLAVRAEVKPGRYTAFRMDGNLDHYFIIEGRRGRNFPVGNACRTQFWLVADAEPGYVADYVSRPLGNHHILIPGSYDQQLRAFFHIAGLKPYQPDQTHPRYDC